MSTLTHEVRAVKIWFDENDLWLELDDARKLSVPLSYFPRLLHATPELRNQFEISGGGTGIHWPELDEDISVQGLLNGVGDLTQNRPS